MKKIRSSSQKKRFCCEGSEPKWLEPTGDFSFLNTRGTFAGNIQTGNGKTHLYPDVYNKVKQSCYFNIEILPFSAYIFFFLYSRTPAFLLAVYTKRNLCFLLILV